MQPKHVYHRGDKSGSEETEQNAALSTAKRTSEGNKEQESPHKKQAIASNSEKPDVAS